MNRTDRLHAIGEALRRAGPRGLSAARLADDLEVSVRTIKRDVGALQQIGLPIWSRSGPGGGYVLEGTASLPPVAFTPAQATAVALALGTMPPASPFSADARAASAKVFDTLGTGARTRAEALARRLWVLPTPAERRPPSGVLRAIERGLVEQVVTTLRYRSAAGVRTRRAVEPIIAARADGHWYLVAHCRLREAIRWFRFERIERADTSRSRYRARSVSEIGAPPAEAVSVADDAFRDP